jgi:hypothetical protein
LAKLSAFRDYVLKVVKPKIVMKKTALIFALFLASNFYAQQKDSLYPINHAVYTQKQTALLTAGNFGANGYAEVGYAKNYNIVGTHLPLANGYYFSAEVRPGDNFIVAPKAGVWTSCIVAVGANAMYYTNFNEGSLCLRPEIGLNILNFRLMWGYNIPLTNKDMKGVNGSNLSVSLSWRLGGDRF